MKAEIPIEIGMSGRYDIEVYDTVQKKVTKRRSSKNMLLDGYLDEILQTNQMACFLHWRNDPTLRPSVLVGGYDGVTRCYLGDDSTAVAASDPYVRNQVGSYKTPIESLTEESAVGDNPSWRKLTWVWPAGEYVGMIREIGIRNETDYGIARQLLSPELDLQSNEELRVSWTIYVDLGTRTFTGTLPAAQRDGVTDIDWVLTINNSQLENFLTFGDNHSSYQSWFGESYTYAPDLKCGDSNTASDLATDTADEIKGTLLYDDKFVKSLQSVPTYVTGSYERESTNGLEHDSPSTVSIGEMVIGSFYGGGHMARITFTPKLDKAQYYRLYITFKFKVVRA